MRFLIDNNLSERLCDLLVAAGHAVDHLRHLDLASADDEEVLGKARALHAVLISADTDFGALLAASGDSAPSVILFRTSRYRPAEQASVLLAHLGEIAEELDLGAVVVIEDERIRVRRLPIGPQSG